MENAGDLEQYIGTRISDLRKERALSQEDLADRISVSYQQVQKYEKGRTRISVSRLVDLAAALGVGLNELIPDEVRAPKLQHSADTLTGGFSLTRDEIRLLKLYRKVGSERMRRIVLDYMRTISES
ncbi:MAG: XRE family transcriptional regulator [Spirochaetaceae bacterium]|nr:MAG: XRE family transcriptional regulator [Spirochaetaceae bacterium]